MINAEQVQTIATSIQALPLDESVLSILRKLYPSIHFTYCMDDDVPNQKAAWRSSQFNLYLIDGREHCLSLTASHENASGILVAEIIEDDHD